MQRATNMYRREKFQTPFAPGKFFSVGNVQVVSFGQSVLTNGFVTLIGSNIDIPFHRHLHYRRTPKQDRSRSARYTYEEAKSSQSTMSDIRVTVWGENVHENTHALVKEIYPTGMHSCIADALNRDPRIKARTATLQETDHGLTPEVLAETDVLTWWGHAAHGEVEDRIVDRVQERVLAGMGLIVLHSGHHSKIFRRLMGHNCNLTWREAGEKERLWITSPGHPIVQGLEKPYFEIEHEEMYGEPFGIPSPDETVFVSWFAGGEVFRSGVTYKRGAGKIFYFRPGHESYPTYHHPIVQQVIGNAVHWANSGAAYPWACPNVPIEQALEPIVEYGGSVH